MMVIRTFLRYCSLLTLSAMVIDAQAQSDTSSFTLEKCISTALENNIDAKQSGLRADAAEVNYNQARANLLPDLNAGFNYGFNRGRTVDPITNSYINQQLSSSGINLNSGIILFNGLRLQQLIRQNRFAYDAATLDWQQVKDNLALNVVLAYLQVLSNEDMLRIARGQLDVIRKQTERLTILVKEGAVGAYQLTDIRGQQAGEELNLVTAENNLQQSKLALCQLMNIPYDPSVKFSRGELQAPDIISLYPLSSAQVFDASTQRMALVKANEFRVKSADKAVQAAKGGFYPVLSFNANMSSSYSSLARSFTPTGMQEVPTGDYVVTNGVQNPVLTQEQNFTASKIGYARQLDNNRGSFAGLNLSIPLFNNFRARNQVKLARINLKSSELQQESTTMQLRQDIEQTWLNMEAAYKRYSILLAQEKDFAESFRSAEIRFGEGVINAYEFLQAKNNLDQVRINLARVKYEYLFRTQMLDFYSGQKQW